MKPLADLVRPTELDEVCGQEHILGKNKILDRIIKSGLEKVLFLLYTIYSNLKLNFRLYL